MSMKKLCQGALFVTAIQSQATAFADPKAPHDTMSDEGSYSKNENVRETQPLPGELNLSESVKDLMDWVYQSSGQPIC